MKTRRLNNVQSIGRATEPTAGWTFEHLDPSVHTAALTFEARLRAGEDVKPADVTGLNIQRWVGAMERCGNRRQRVERLVSAWNQGTRGNAETDGEADDPLIDESAEPKRRPRTRLTDEEVDAMRTAREQGVSVTALAKRYRVHRGTVWAKTRASR